VGDGLLEVACQRSRLHSQTVTAKITAAASVERLGDEADFKLATWCKGQTNMRAVL
jgi:hypothetical protein